jgi:16S rRNA (cytosine967-C5)-methyltransferase
MPVDLVRDAAIDVLLRVFDRGIYLDVSLDKTIRRKKPSDRGRRFLTQLVYGTVRYAELSDFILQRICTQPLEKLPRPIHVLLRMAVFQTLFCNQVTKPAMVHTSVDLAKRRGHAGLARMTNAVLRKVPDDLESVKWPDLAREPEEFLRIRYSMPLWLVKLWRSTYGHEKAEALCVASNIPAPTTLRCNTLQTNTKELIENLTKSDFTVTQDTDIPEEITVQGGGAPLRTKWFQNGHFMIQDAASMLPPHLLEPAAGEHILDLCAAPGGKTTHLAQLAGSKAHIVALDSGFFRMARVVENVERLGIEGVTLVNANGLQPPFGQVFDRVLVDAPCSGLGTLRRHPDLKWRMDSQAMTRLASQQVDLLRSAVRVCKNGGLIVYSVCTFTQQETTEVIQTILNDGLVQLEDGPEFLTRWKTAQGQYQTDPSSEALDGFFLTRLRKVS